MGQDGLGLPPASETTASPYVFSGCHVITWEFGTDPASDPDKLFLDGTESVYTTQGASARFRSSGTFQIGGSANLNGDHFWGLNSSLYIFNRKLNPSEVQSAYQYGKRTAIDHGSYWNDPPTHRGTTPNIVCGGDSITAGLGVATSFCSHALLKTGDNPTIENVALSGKLMATISPRVIPEMQPYFVTGSARNTAILFACTNDIGGGKHRSPADCWNDMALASQTLRARGWKTILIPIFDAGNIPPITKAAFEGSFVSNCPKVADACISPDDPNLYADGANASHVWFQDKIHPTQVGQDALAQYVIHAYQQVWGSTQLKRTVYTGGPCSQVGIALLTLLRHPATSIFCPPASA